MVTKTDLVIPGRLPVTLTRTAQTNGAVNGPFGRGTTHTTQVVLLVEASRRSLQSGDGRRVVPKLPVEVRFDEGADTLNINHRGLIEKRKASDGDFITAVSVLCGERDICQQRTWGLRIMA